MAEVVLEVLGRNVIYNLTDVLSAVNLMHLNFKPIW